MQAFSIDTRKFHRFKTIEILHLSFNLSIALIIFIMLLLPFISGKELSLSNVWDILYLIGTGIILFLCLNISMLLVRFIRLSQAAYNKYRDIVIEINDRSLVVIDKDDKKEYLLDTTEFHNFLSKHDNPRHPLFGQGYLKIAGQEHPEITIPSMVFDLSVGAYSVRDLLKSKTNYSESKVNYATLYQYIK